MIEDWYFCCCIKSSPDNTATFLSILDILENDHDDNRLLMLAFQELGGAEIWMQIYALPRVLRTFRSVDIPENVRMVLKPYFDGLVELVPGKESAEIFRGLVDCILQGVGSHGLRRALNACLDVIPALPVGRHSTNEPYLDMKLFLPEILILSVALNELSRDKSSISALGRGGDETETVVMLQTLLDEALDHNLGRMAYRLAANISRIAGQPRERIRSSVFKIEGAAPALEPDLLQVYAMAKYLKVPDKMDDDARKKAVHNLILESRIFKDYNKKFFTPEKSGEPTPTALRRVGMETIEKGFRETIELVYWQAILWGMAMRLNEKETGRILAEYWRPPVSEEINNIMILSGFDKKTNINWASRLTMLSSMHGMWKRPYISIKPAKHLKMPEVEGCTLYSPWVYRKNKKQRRKEPHYTDIKKHGVLIRLAAGALLSIHLLRRLPEDFPSRQEFTAFIAHASHAFYTVFGIWLRNFRGGDIKDGVPTLPPALTGLALFCQMHVSEAGRGHMANIVPGDFVQLLNKTPNPDHTSIRNTEEQKFVTTILPLVLTRWIMDAYGGVIDANGPGRWFEHLPEVYKIMTGQGIPFLRYMEAVCAMRFLRPSDTSLNIRSFDWRTASNKDGPLEWKGLSARQILLTRHDLAPDEWIRIDWEEKFDPKKGGGLPRAIERFASLKNVRGSVDEKTEGEWRSEWKRLLSEVDQTQKMDRFIRLRLLEILDDPMLENDEEGQELIAQVVMEYGSVYELNKLIQMTFKPENLSTNGEISAARIQLQKKLLPLMRNKIRTLEEQAKGAFQNPRLTLRNRQAIDLINRSFSLITGSLIKMNDPYGLKNILKQLFTPDTVMERSIETDIEWRNRGRHLALRGNVTPIKDWMVHCAVVDPNRQRVTLFYHDVNTDGLVNLFECTRDEIEAFQRTPSGKTIDVFAVIAANDVPHPKNRDEQIQSIKKHICVFNCGPFHVSGHQPNKDLKPGNFVRINISRSEVDGNWRISETSSVWPLRPRERIGDIDEVEVTLYWSRDEKRINLDMRRSRGLLGEPDMKLWDTSIYNPFDEMDKNESYKVWAMLDADHGWTPLDLDLNQLLLNAFVYNNAVDEKSAVLTFIETIPGPYGGSSWRFSTMPGYNYLLHDHQFEPESRKHLYEIFSDEKLPTGLIVTVVPHPGKDETLLSLEKTGMRDTALENIYPDLTVPFDDRNLRWKSLFSEVGIAFAETDGKRWSATPDAPPIPGYPRKVQINWKKDPYSHEKKRIEFQVEDWNYRKGFVTGVPLFLNFLKLKKSEWPSFYHRMINLKKWERLVVVGAIRTVNPKGYISCLTEERLLVQVKTESLTNNRLPLKKPIEILEPRIVVLYSHPFQGRRPLDVDRDSIPNDIFADDKDKHVGILNETPGWGVGGTQCQVLWEKDNRIEMRELRIINLSDLSLRPGCKITAQRTLGEWDFTVEFIHLRADALWVFKDWVPDRDNPVYLGRAMCQGQWSNMGEQRPGVLAAIGRVPPGSNHLATSSEDEYVGGLSPETSARISHREDRAWSVKRNGKKVDMARVVLSMGSNILAGNCETLAPSGNLSVVDVSLRLRDMGGGYYTLAREFKVERKRIKKTMLHVVSEVGKECERLKQDLMEYLNNPFNLDATYKKGVISLFCDKPEKAPANATRQEWGSNPEKADWTINPILAEHEGAFVEDRGYDASDAKVWLFEDGDEKVRASFRRVQPDTLNDFQDRLRVGFGEVVNLKTGLAYVGSETANPVAGVSYKEIHHRFEWGYGKTLLVPESRLRYMNDKFKKSQFVLFHGDVVTTVVFYPDTENPADIQPEDEIEDFAEETRPPCIMDIIASSIEISPETELYFQSKKHKIIHVLHLTYDGEKFRIDHVEGFDDAAGDMEKGTLDFRASRAVLSDSSRERLIQRVKMKHNKNEESELVVFGRLNVMAFEKTRGERLEFEHVRLSFRDSVHGSPIKPDSLVFMQAGSIEDREYDTMLNVFAPDKIDKTDIEPDMAGLKILRRQFSARENTLSNYYQAKGENSLRNAILMVRLTLMDKKTIVLSLKDRMPPRKIRALTGAPGFREGFLLATAVAARKEKDLHLELRPGVFVHLTPEKIEECPIDLIEGAIVRVKSAPGRRFTIKRAVFADARYVPDHTRLAVGFPKHNLLTPRGRKTHKAKPQKFWEKGQFIIGGLPNISAMPGIYNAWKNEWYDAKDEKFIKLMECGHPKIVAIAKDQKGKVRLAPPPPNAPVGGLRVGKNGFDVFLSPSGEISNETSKRRLKWRFLSFGDEPARSIIDRSNRETWVYHDKTTGKWKNGDVKEIPVKPHKVWRGPVFFDDGEADWRLRYDQNDFTRFGYPVGELLHSLKHIENRVYPVAGVSTDGGLWLELAPGRIVELPAQMVVWKSGGSVKPIAHLDWQAFAPGDVVELSLMEKDKLTPASVVLQNWIPGPRAAMGKQRCFLPLSGSSPEDGSVTLGSCLYTLTLPVSETDELRGHVITLDSRNVIHHSKPPFKPDDVVLMGLNEKGMPVICGFPKLFPLPAPGNSDAWLNDPFADTINWWEKERFSFKGLADLIQAAGGTLPFTVENATQGAIYLSRRIQCGYSSVPEGSISIARVTGLLNDGNTALLRYGGGIVKLPMDHVVCGLPHRFFQSAMRVLKTSGTIIWLRGHNHGTIQTGIKNDAENEIYVRAIHVVSIDKLNYTESGMICISNGSNTLYWLPGSHASYTPLSHEQMRRLFVDPNENTIFVRLCGADPESCFVSVIEVRENEWEFRAHGVESELAVDLLENAGKKDNGANRYLVRSARTGIIMECEEYNDKNLLAGQNNFRVEVIKRVSGVPRQLITALLGKKRLSLDLPVWMMQQLPDPGELRPNFIGYLGWLRDKNVDSLMQADAELIELVKNEREISDNFFSRVYNGFKNRNISIWNDYKLDEFLHRAYRCLENKTPCLKFQTAVAEDWICKNINKSEIAPQFAVMAVLLLFENTKVDDEKLSMILRCNRVKASEHKSRWRNMATDMTINLGRRAVRSMHVEVLCQKWLFNTLIDGRRRTLGLWKRLNFLVDNICTPIKVQNIGAIRHFTRAVKLRGESDTDLLSVSDALSASTGIINSTINLLETAEVLQRLSRIHRTIPLSQVNTDIELPELYIRELKQFLKIINSNQIDLMLLDPIPLLEIKGDADGAK